MTALNDIEKFIREYDSRASEPFKDFLRRVSPAINRALLHFNTRLNTAVGPFELATNCHLNLHLPLTNAC